MNKKYYVYSALMMLLMVGQQSFAMQAKLLQYAVRSALISAGSYGGSKMVAAYKRSVSEDMPEAVEKWVRKIFAESDCKNADSIPLKMGNGSFCYGGHFIALDRNRVDSLNWRLARGDNSENEFALDERCALHELKHFENGDCGKGLLLLGCSFASLLQPSSIPVLALKLGMIAGGNLIYRRYQEGEANRFAYMKLSSLEKLEIVKSDKKEDARFFEYDLLNNPFSYYEGGLLEMWTRAIVHNKLNALEQKMVDCGDNPDELLKMQQQKRRLIKVAYFAHDCQHPDYQSAAELAQECIDKRKTAEWQGV